MRLVLILLVTAVSACDGFYLPPPPGCEDCCGTRIGGFTSRLWMVQGDLSLEERISFHDDDFTLNAVAFGDLDGDGTEDAVFASHAFGGLGLTLDVTRGDGRVDVREDLLEPSDAPQLVLADVDDDGDLDVLAAMLGGDSALLLENDGAAGFTSLGVAFPDVTRVLAVELDGEAPIEILGTNGSGPLLVMQGSARGALDVPEVTSGIPVAIDVDGDGDLDLVQSGYRGSDERILVVRDNDGTGALEERVLPLDVAEGATVSLLSGVRELLVQENRQLSVLPLNADGAGPARSLGTLPEDVPCAYGSCNAVLVDFTGDGTLDALVASPNGALLGFHESGLLRAGGSGELQLVGETPWLLDAPMRCTGEGF